LISFASDLNWEDKVASSNIFSREAGCKAPWRTEAGTLNRFRGDAEIPKASQHAQAVERRANNGAEVSWNDDHPEQLISVRVGLVKLVQSTAGEQVSVATTGGAKKRRLEWVSGGRRIFV
jgi:hypothetical protein